MATGRPFQPGVSGNPGGRPRQTPEARQIKELAKEKSLQAIEILTEIMQDPTAKNADRLRAVETLLDRAFGRPTTTVDVPDDGRDKLKEIADAIDRSRKPA